MNRPPYRRADEIAAYTYMSDTYCPPCLIGHMVRTGEASLDARDMPTEHVLDQCAAANAIERTDEASYDSSEFPKVVFLHQLADSATCDHCRMEF
jgi:hypothetical protein